MYYNIHAHQHSPEPHERLILSLFPAGDAYPVERHGYFTAALHPAYLHTLKLQEGFAWLNKMIPSSFCLGIGETGLDARIKNETIQEDIFIRHIRLAQEFEMPLILHCVRKHERVIQLIKQEQFKGFVIWHGWNKGIDLTEKVIDLGHYISLGFNEPAFKKSVHVTSSFIPLSQLFFETDTRVIPVRTVYQHWCNYLKTDLTILETIVEENVEKVFGNKLGSI